MSLYLRHRQLQEENKNVWSINEKNNAWVIICSIGVAVTVLFLLVNIYRDCFTVEGGTGIQRSTVSARIEEQKKQRAMRDAERKREAELTEAKHMQKQAEKRRRKRELKKNGKKGGGKKKKTRDENSRSRSGKRHSHGSSNSSDYIQGPPRRQDARKIKKRNRQAKKRNSQNSKSRPTKGPRHEDSSDSSDYVQGPPRRGASKISSEEGPTYKTKSSVPYARVQQAPATIPTRRRSDVSESSVESIESSSDDDDYDLQGPTANRQDKLEGRQPGVPYARPDPSRATNRRPSDVSESSEESIEPSSSDDDDYDFQEPTARRQDKSEGSQPRVPYTQPDPSRAINSTQSSSNNYVSDISDSADESTSTLEEINPRPVIQAKSIESTSKRKNPKMPKVQISNQSQGTNSVKEKSKMKQFNNKEGKSLSDRKTRKVSDGSKTPKKAAVKGFLGANVSKSPDA